LVFDLKPLQIGGFAGNAVGDINKGSNREQVTKRDVILQVYAPFHQLLMKGMNQCFAII
jgi:hypothetical protein